MSHRHPVISRRSGEGERVGEGERGVGGGRIITPCLGVCPTHVWYSSVVPSDSCFAGNDRLDGYLTATCTYYVQTYGTSHAYVYIIRHNYRALPSFTCMHYYNIIWK